MLRLLLALLISCLALPAVAAEACAPVPSAAEASHDHHQPPQPDQKAPHEAMTHVCVGCVPPLSGACRAGEPAAVAAIAFKAERPRAPLGTSDGPVPPPPRLG